MKTLKMRFFIIGFLAVIGFTIQGCGGPSSYFENAGDTENQEMLSLIGTDENFSTFANLARTSGLDLKLNFTGPVTLFVPTNEAFEEMPRDQYNSLVDPANRAELSRFLQRHILPTKVYESQFNTLQVIETAVEEEIPVTTGAQGTIIYIGGAQIIQSDIETSDGIVHIVNSVIEPSEDILPE